ncbi:hypothetical protein HK098_002834 [Nowakowskiella sp. JEL0407]|nr:hypothetical protein HK098_002834 [Nowakowskiella sp. JEL0407]
MTSALPDPTRYFSLDREARLDVIHESLDFLNSAPSLPSSTTTPFWELIFLIFNDPLQELRKLAPNLLTSYFKKTETPYADFKLVLDKLEQTEPSSRTQYIIFKSFPIFEPKHPDDESTTVNDIRKLLEMALTDSNIPSICNKCNSAIHYTCKFLVTYHAKTHNTDYLYYYFQELASMVKRFYSMENNDESVVNNYILKSVVDAAVEYQRTQKANLADENNGMFLALDNLTHEPVNVVEILLTTLIVKKFKPKLTIELLRLFFEWCGLNFVWVRCNILQILVDFFVAESRTATEVDVSIYEESARIFEFILLNVFQSPPPDAMLVKSIHLYADLIQKPKKLCFEYKRLLRRVSSCVFEYNVENQSVRELRAWLFGLKTILATGLDRFVEWDRVSVKNRLEIVVGFVTEILCECWNEEPRLLAVDILFLLYQKFGDWKAGVGIFPEGYVEYIYKKSMGFLSSKKTIRVLRGVDIVKLLVKIKRLKSETGVVEFLDELIFKFEQDVEMITETDLLTGIAESHVMHGYITTLSSILNPITYTSILYHTSKNNSKFTKPDASSSLLTPQKLKKQESILLNAIDVGRKYLVSIQTQASEFQIEDDFDEEEAEENDEENGVVAPEREKLNFKTICVHVSWRSIKSSCEILTWMRRNEYNTLMRRENLVGESDLVDLTMFKDLTLTSENTDTSQTAYINSMTLFYCRINATISLYKSILGSVLHWGVSVAVHNHLEELFVIVRAVIKMLQAPKYDDVRKMRLYEMFRKIISDTRTESIFRPADNSRIDARYAGNARILKSLVKSSDVDDVKTQVGLIVQELRKGLFGEEDVKINALVVYHWFLNDTNTGALIPINDIFLVVLKDLDSKSNGIRSAAIALFSTILTRYLPKKTLYRQESVLLKDEQALNKVVEVVRCYTELNSVEIRVLASETLSKLIVSPASKINELLQILGARFTNQNSIHGMLVTLKSLLLRIKSADSGNREWKEFQSKISVDVIALWSKLSGCCGINKELFFDVTRILGCEVLFAKTVEMQNLIVDSDRVWIQVQLIRNLNDFPDNLNLLLTENLQKANMIEWVLEWITADWTLFTDKVKGEIIKLLFSNVSSRYFTKYVSAIQQVNLQSIKELEIHNGIFLQLTEQAEKSVDTYESTVMLFFASELFHLVKRSEVLQAKWVESAYKLLMKLKSEDSVESLILLARSVSRFEVPANLQSKVQFFQIIWHILLSPNDEVKKAAVISANSVLKNIIPKCGFTLIESMLSSIPITTPDDAVRYLTLIADPCPEYHTGLITVSSIGKNVFKLQSKNHVDVQKSKEVEEFRRMAETEYSKNVGSKKEKTKYDKMLTDLRKGWVDECILLE